MRVFSWRHLLSGLQNLQAQLDRLAEPDVPQQEAPERMPYIELTLPITGVLTPITKRSI